MKARKMVLMAMLVGLYFILSMYGTIKLGQTMKITVDGLPIVIGALIFGPVEGMVIGLMGSFLSQLLGYGITATTILWIIPAGIRGLIVGLYAKKHGGIEIAKGQLAFILIVSGILVTIVNTGSIYLDSLIYGYYNPVVVFGPVPVRLLNGVITAIAYVAVTYPLLKCVKSAVPDLVKWQRLGGKT